MRIGGGFRMRMTGGFDENTHPGGNKGQRRAVFVTQRRFTDLLRKQVWREKIESMPNADVFLRHADGGLEQVALGESTSSSPMPSIDVAQMDAGEQARKEAPLPWFVQAGLRAITTEQAYDPSGMQLKIVCPVGKLAPVFSLPVVISEDGVIANELLFTGLDGGIRQRRGCFVEVLGKGSYRRCVLILEGRRKSARPEVALVDSAELKCAIEIVVPRACSQ